MHLSLKACFAYFPPLSHLSDDESAAKAAVLCSERTWQSFARKTKCSNFLCNWRCNNMHVYSEVSHWIQWGLLPGKCHRIAALEPDPIKSSTGRRLFLPASVLQQCRKVLLALVVWAYRQIWASTRKSQCRATQWSLTTITGKQFWSKGRAWGRQI